MNESAPVDLRERVFRFVCDVFDFCEELAMNPGMSRRIAYQLFDAASSIGANLEEAKAAYSGRDFAAKNSICLKEPRVDALVAMLTAGFKKLRDSRPSC